MCAGAGWATAALAACGSHRAQAPAPRPPGRVTLTLADHPELAFPGGRVEIAAPGRAHPILLRRTTNGPVLALSLACPHARCTVRPTPGGDGLVCPCHGSRFTADGALLSGPATRDLSRLPTHEADGRLAIDLEAPP